MAVVNVAAFEKVLGDIGHLLGDNGEVVKRKPFHRQTMAIALEVDRVVTDALCLRNAELPGLVGELIHRVR